MNTVERKPARDRLLDAADELFYEEGVHVVGIDRVIERAGVAKATLYSSFGSKDELVRAYLQRRSDRRKARITKALAERFDSAPRAQMLGIFEMLVEHVQDPTFRGCAFYNACAESEPGSIAHQVSDESRGWTRSLFVRLATEGGAADPEALAQRLTLLYDGATVASRMDRDPTGAVAARDVATALIDAVIAG